MLSKFIRAMLAVALTLGPASPAMAAGSSGSSDPPAEPTKYDLGVKAVKAANFERAVGLLRKVVADDPNNADAWNYIGLSQRKMKQFGKALTAYGKALTIDPDHRGANEYLGELYLQTGKPAKARERLAKLNKLCLFGCEEYDDLKKAIRKYEARQKSK